MNVTKESENPTEVTLSISMDTADQEPFLSRSYRRLVTRVQIPGFRPGKAPRPIVENHVGRAALVQEALEFMIPETLDQVLKDHELQAFSEPHLELLEMDPVQFKAVVPLEPIVNLGDFRAIRLARAKVEVTDEEVAEVLEELRLESAPWAPVERPAQFGDLLNLNVKGTILGEDLLDEHEVDFIMEQENPLPLPGFSVYLEGMTEGQDKDFSLNVPDTPNYFNNAGQECRLSVTVLSIKAKALADLDDEFAKGVRDGYETLEDLRAEISQRLTANQEAQAQQEFEQSTLDQLLEICTVQASGLVYQQELELMREDRERAIRSRQMDMQTYLSVLGKTAEEWQEEMRPAAEKRLKTYLVLRKVAEAEEIDVSDEEVEAEIESVLANSGENQEAVSRALANEQTLQSIRSSLFNRKVMARLVGMAQGDEDEAQSQAIEEDSPEAGAAQDESANDEPAEDEPTNDEPADDESTENNPDATPDNTTESDAAESSAATEEGADPDVH